jgi:hypothetical protein
MEWMLEDKEPRPVKSGNLLNQSLWKEKPIIGKVVSLEKAMLNFDCISGKIKYFPGVMFKIENNGLIQEAGILGSVEDYKEFIGEEVDYLYEKIELSPQIVANNPLYKWNYTIKIINNPEKNLKNSYTLNL